jgi:hypothetical protein
MKTLQHPQAYSYRVTQKRVDPFALFFTWCKSQEQYRFGWLAAIIASHGCLITPLTLFTIMLSGNSPVYWAFAIASMTIAIVSNLAAMPTKITIPVFFFSIIIDVAVIIICLTTIIK